MDNWTKRANRFRIAVARCGVSRASKPPLDVLVGAWLSDRNSLAEFSHRNSPKELTRQQLFACLVLKVRNNLLLLKALVPHSSRAIRSRSSTVR